MEKENYRMREIKSLGAGRGIYRQKVLAGNSFDVSIGQVDTGNAENR